MQTQTTYLGLSIGPVVSSLNQAQTTRELWVMSYFLSELARIAVLTEIGGRKPLSPTFINPPTYGAGVYPDRVYWELNEQLSSEDLIKAQKAILAQLSKESANDYLAPEELSSYFRMVWVQGTWTEEELGKKTFLKQLNDLLDMAELSEKWEHNTYTDIITKLIGKGMKKGSKRPIYTLRKKSLEATPPELIPYLISEDMADDVGRFPSIIEIATLPLKMKDEECKKWYKDHVEKPIFQKLNNDEKEDDEGFMTSIKNHFSNKDANRDFFLACHKYVCIIQSDGDGIGKLLGAIGNYTKNIDKFSECLGFFSREASKMVVEYGGTPIFAGGDDVLFLAPVRHKDKDDKNIFDLLESLNRLFIDIFKGNEAICKLEIKEEIEEDGKKKEVMVKPVDKLAQSFGVSITYYKHPLQEALKTTTDLLFITAKSHIENNDKRLKKNAIAFKVQKHSGQYFDACINMKGQFYEQFQKLLNEYKREDSRYLSSVMFTLREQQKVLRLIAEDKQKIANFFDKNFDEKPHDENRGLINAIRDLVHTQFKENPSDEDFKVCKKTDTKDKKLEYNMERIFACLKFIHFLRAKDHQND